MKLLSIKMLLVILICFNITAVFGRDDKKKDVVVPVAFTDGIVYSLPRTGIRIFVEVQQEKFFHGPYYEYAEKYLGIKNAPSSDFEEWTITDVKFDTYSEPDPNQVYKAFGPVASMLNLSEEGVLLGINSGAESLEREVYTSDFTTQINVPKEIWTDRSMHSFLAEIDTLPFTMWESKQLEEKAKEAAHDITKLRKRKFLTLAANYDQLPPDGKAYAVMVKELEKIERKYVALFAGKSYTKKHKYVFEVVPGADNGKGVVAFRFSASEGVQTRSNLSGKPIMLGFTPNKELIQNGGEASDMQKSADAGKSGVYYRVPANGVISLHNGEELANARVTVAQFGKVTAVPEGLLDGSYSIKYHPVTGAIKSVNKK
jgi:hypothetical protein